LAGFFVYADNLRVLMGSAYYSKGADMVRTVQQGFWLVSLLLMVIIGLLGWFWPSVWWTYVLVLPIFALGVYDVWQKKHILLRLYPVIGHLRYLLEAVRPEIQQYFVEDDINGRPINREFRSLVYQRAQGERDTRGFGTQYDVYAPGYEWLNHSINPKEGLEPDPRVMVGEKQCEQPYALSLLNISALSYGALSRHAILALNKGAKLGGALRTIPAREG
jgi:glutamate synthase domain-containing protein 2